MSDGEIEQPWLTPELRSLLGQIRSPHVEKKRRTVILLAFALANNQPVADVFNRDDTCAQQNWYGKWRHLADVKAALDACYQRVLDCADEDTARLEAHFRRQRRQAIGRHAAAAPGVLADIMADSGQRGADRINAALSLVRLADGGEVAPVATTEIRNESSIEISAIDYRQAVAPLAPIEEGPVEDSAASGAD